MRMVARFCTLQEDVAGMIRTCLVFVDRLTKSAVFISTTTSVTSEEFAHLFLNGHSTHGEVLVYHG
ncbi:hypothetical protein I350_01691 [Cryptococcus amylolentus CBS 6273]|uniref:Uncharacterized protein n=1 Tax=Cryptococcus amylolentus CBS 6273 TaxID=1296118 RepID=A0A1E3KDB5_9TREE|nr:hypothetical protein I350_01691 [Cryptococcus amylolentus CBS 6273]